MSNDNCPSETYSESILRELRRMAALPRTSREKALFLERSKIQPQDTQELLDEWGPQPWFKCSQCGDDVYEDCITVCPHCVRQICIDCKGLSRAFETPVQIN